MAKKSMIESVVQEAKIQPQSVKHKNESKLLQADLKSTSVNKFRIQKKDGAKAKYIPPEIRYNPFADLKVLTKKDLDQGIYTLMTQGYIPKDVDILPAIQRDNPIFHAKRMTPEEIIYNDSILDLNIDRMQFESRVDSVDGSGEERSKTQSLFVSSDKQKEFNPTYMTAPIISYDSNNPQANRRETPTSSERQRMTRAQDLVKKMTQIILEVSNGSVKEDESYKKFRSQNRQQWGDIQEAIDKVLEEAYRHSITTFRMYTTQTKEIAFMMREPTTKELQECIEKFSVVKEYVQQRNSPAKMRASALRVILKLQKQLRSCIALRFRKKLLSVKKKIRRIQFQIKLKYFHRQTLKKMTEVNAQRYKQFISRTKAFVQSWNTISQGKRFEIHINSLGYDQFMKKSSKHYNSRQGSHLSRIFRLVDPNVHIVLVSPTDINLDVLNYYVKMLEISGVPNVEDRLHLITPVN